MTKKNKNKKEMNKALKELIKISLIFGIWTFIILAMVFLSYESKIFTIGIMIISVIMLYNVFMVNNFAKNIRLIRKLKHGKVGDMNFEDVGNMLKLMSQMQRGSQEPKEDEKKKTKKSSNNMYG